KLGALVAALAPGIFSGIAAMFLFVPITLSAILGGGRPPWAVFVVDGFGWLSGFFALGLFVTRFRFLRQPFRKQVTFAVIIWSVHVAAFIMLLVASRYF